MLILKLNFNIFHFYKTTRDNFPPATFPAISIHRFDKRLFLFISFSGKCSNVYIMCEDLEND